MQNFLRLSEEKQNKIIDAALRSFGANGYKKTSISDIAAAAGISKAMIFHYFGTKKALYFYLIDLSSNILIKEINKSFDKKVPDFFDRISLATDSKILAIKKHPAILSFLNSMYFERDDIVKADIQTLLAKGEGFRNRIAFEGMDASKFKDGIDPKLVLKMLTWLVEGYIAKVPNKEGYDIEVLRKEFGECIDLFKNNFYREEYL